MTVQCLITSCIVQLNKSLKGLKLHWPNILYFSTGSILERKWDWSISLSLVCLCKYAFHKTSDQLTPTGYKFLALFLVDKINGRVTSQMFFCLHEDFFIHYLVFVGIRICHCFPETVILWSARRITDNILVLHIVLLWATMFKINVHTSCNIARL